MCVKKNQKARSVIVCLYLDDLLMTRDNEFKIEEFKINMVSEFEITDIGQLSYFLVSELESATIQL